MRNHLMVVTKSDWERYRAEGQLDGLDTALQVLSWESPPCVNLYWGPVSLSSISVEAAQVLGEHLLLAVKALAEEVSHD